MSDPWNSGEVALVPHAAPGRAGHEMLACACGAGVAAIGVVGLAGWAVGALAFAGAAAAWIPAAPSTLAAFVLLGAALPLSTAARGRRAVRGAQWLAVPVVVVATGVLLRVGAGSAAVHGAIPLGRMSPLTATALALAAVAVLLRRRAPDTVTAPIRGACAVGALAIGVVTGLGYVHGVPLLYGGLVIPVAFPTALGLALLGLGLLALDAPTLAPLRAFLGDSVRARLLRGFVPSMVALVAIADVAHRVLARRVASSPAVWSAFMALVTVIAVAAMAAALAGRIGGDVDRAVAARKRAEAKARRLAQALGSVADCVTIADLDNTTTFVNDAFVLAYGYTPGEVLGRDIDFVRSSRNRQGLGAEILAATLAGGWRGEVWQRRKDGTEFLVSLSTSLVRDDDGSTVAFVSVAQDITVRRQAEVALRASDERFRLLVEHLGEGVGIVDEHERFVLANPAAEAIFAVEPGTLVGRSLMEFVVPAQNSLIAAESGRRQAGEVSSYEVEIVRSDGAPRRLHAMVSPLPSPDGGYTGAIGVFRDVTSERHREEQLRQAQKMEAVGRLAAVIAHDFNNLLQAMGNLTHLLGAGSADPARAHALAADLSGEVRRGAGLARQLLLFSRQAATKRERLDLNEIVGQTEPLLRHLLPANVTLLLQPGTSPLPVEADRNQIEQVLLNLADNGADAMPEGGLLAVRTGSKGDSVWLEVEDAGGGVPEEIRARIFEPFFSTKGATKDTGLGLAVVQGIAAEHGGSVDLVSAPGAGATFRFVLPRAADPAAAASLREAAGTPEGGRGARVLVVEDEDGARASLAEVLAALGYRVTAVASAEGVAALPAGATYDVLLTDFRLPGASGADLARELRARWPALRVILMSGYTADEAVRQGVSAGTMRFLQKPFDMDSLARELHAALASSA